MLAARQPHFLSRSEKSSRSLRRARETLLRTLTGLHSVRSLPGPFPGKLTVQSSIQMPFPSTNIGSSPLTQPGPCQEPRLPFLPSWAPRVRCPPGEASARSVPSPRLCLHLLCPPPGPPSPPEPKPNLLSRVRLGPAPSTSLQAPNQCLFPSP